MIPTDPDEREALAGQYVLGLLDEAARREVGAAMAEDVDLARRVNAWEARLLPALSTLPPVDPDPALWERIERGITSPVAFSPARPTATDRRARVRRYWESAPLWRTTTALASAAAVLLAVLPLRLGPGREEGAPSFFAVLQGRDAGGNETGPGWILEIAADGTVSSRPLDRIAPGRGQALQLWTLWDRDRGPVSLGVLPVGGSVRLPPDRLPVIGGGQLFEITLEPEAGSPTGRPTGRILFIGRASSSVTRPL